MTVKTRLGWSSETIVIEDVAKMLEQLGVACLTVHARTREAGYKGSADWSWFPKIKTAAGSMPVFANGDMESPQCIKTVLDLGVDGVMIGRAAIANPWLFKRTKHYLATGELLPDAPITERIQVCLRHLREQAALKGERRGVPSFRKYYSSYLRGVRNIAHLRRDLMQFMEVAPIEDLLLSYLEKYEDTKSVPA